MTDAAPTLALRSLQPIPMTTFERIDSLTPDQFDVLYDVAVMKRQPEDDHAAVDLVAAGLLTMAPAGDSASLTWAATPAVQGAWRLLIDGVVLG